jgi:hypothetical protein
MNAPAWTTVTPVRVADLLAEGSGCRSNHPDARVLVDTA